MHLPGYRSMSTIMCKYNSMSISRFWKSSKPWYVLSYGTFKAMGCFKLWCIPNYGIFQATVCSKLWYVPSYGIFQAMVYSKLCYAQSYGICQAMVYSKLWNSSSYGMFSIFYLHNDKAISLQKYISKIRYRLKKIVDFANIFGNLFFQNVYFVQGRYFLWNINLMF